MMLFLQQYNFTVVYRKGSSLHLADTLSRAPYHDKATTPSLPTTFQVFRPHRQQLRQAIAACQDMQLLAHYVIHGWPLTR